MPLGMIPAYAGIGNHPKTYNHKCRKHDTKYLPFVTIYTGFLLLFRCFLPQSFAKYFAEQRKENSAQLCGKTFSQNSVLNIGDFSDSFLAFETITYSTFVCACFHNPLGDKWIERVGEGRR